MPSGQHPSPTSDAARRVVLDLLARRAPEATICPSEAARALASDGDWRGEMAAVHAAVERLAAQGIVRLTWRGAPRLAGDGPYRIARTTSDR